MCGRYTLSTPADELAAEFGAPVPDGYAPRFNVAPQQPVLVLGVDGAGRRRLSFLRWGLVPWWTPPADARAGPINARAETVATRPTFREAFRRRRCLIPADGFYEWKRAGTVRVPFRFRLPGDRPMAFAGLWESHDAGGEPLYTCAIVTTAASPDVSPIHGRMPVILSAGAPRDRWIDPDADPATLASLLLPGAQPALEVYEVSRLVNDAANDSPACILPL